jgi:predicted  nucleic acid-binding Zn-ribbon protein
MTADRRQVEADALERRAELERAYDERDTLRQEATETAVRVAELEGELRELREELEAAQEVRVSCTLSILMNGMPVIHRALTD